MTFYDRYQQLCVEAGSSATGVAVSVGISRASVSDWKNKGAVPSASSLKKIADYFGVSTDYLLGKTDIKNPPDQQSPEEIAKVALFGGDGEVTDDMWNEVKGFVEFIKDKRKRENDNN